MQQSKLLDLYDAWLKWSFTADKSENGWESDFQNWSELIAETKSMLVNKYVSVEDIEVIGFIIAISEESEELLDFMFDNIKQCWKVIPLLAKSKYPACRWQVYVVASQWKEISDNVLRIGIHDEDPYARRRALLSLATTRPKDAKQLAEEYLVDKDPYIRMAAIEFVVVVNDMEFTKRKCNQLVRDDSQIVIKAAIHRLKCK